MLCLTVLVSADMLSLKISFGLDIINQQKWKIKNCTQGHVCNLSRMSHYSDDNTIVTMSLLFPAHFHKPQTMQQKRPKRNNKTTKQPVTRQLSSNATHYLVDGPEAFCG